MPETDVKGENYEIKNLDRAIEIQLEKFDKIREKIGNLEFHPVEAVGNYEKITYAAIDGGKMGIYFDPFELEFVEIADSYDNEIIKVLLPKGEKLDKHDFEFMNEFEEIKTLLNIVRKNSVDEISQIIQDPKKAMEVLEYSCIFKKIDSQPKDSPLIVFKDGLLRTKALTSDTIKNLIPYLSEKAKERKYLVGVAKSSRVLNLIESAIFVENVFPEDQTGYIEVPLEIELMAYKWTGRGKITSSSQPLEYAFGKLYVGKLSKKSNLLVTVEIPYDYNSRKSIYSADEIYQIFGHLIYDSESSYPIIGYPQTIMRAHEKAVRIGFSASLIRDLIIDRIFEHIKNEDLKQSLKTSEMLREYVNKGNLGGV